MNFNRTLDLTREFFRKGYAWAFLHKFWSAIILIVVLYGGYHVYAATTAPSTATRYVTTTVATGTVVAAITETGQVSATAQVDVNAKASGQVLSLLVSPGDHVAAGAALAYLDPTDAQKEVRDAEANVKSAQISLAKLQEPSDQSTLINAQNSLSNARSGAYSDISSAFLDLPSVLAGLDSVLHTRTGLQENELAYAAMIESNSAATIDAAAVEAAYQKAFASFTSASTDFQVMPREASDADIESLIGKTYQASSDLSDALTAATNLLGRVNTALSTNNLALPSGLTSQLSSLTSDETKINTHVAALSPDANTIESSLASLTKLQNGADPLDVESNQLSLTKAQNALTDAQTDLANTTVRALFDGTIASIGVQKYSTVSSGGAVALMVSDNQSVDISVNEVDAAKLKVGQKATLTFDAVPDISIAGTLSSLNAIGSVTQGVVSYDATITFDTPNTSVKPGMSASADIVIGSETGLVVPSSAVKGTGNASYVEIFTSAIPGSQSLQGAVSATAPIRTSVKTGLSDDSNIIIESGLMAGAQVVTQTFAGTAVTTAKTSAAQSTSLFGGAAAARPTGGAGGARALTR